MAWKNTSGMPQINRETVTIDATGQVVGRLATKVANILVGKNKATYVPHIDAGAIVKITNADKLVLTGKKLETAVHYRSSNRPGGVKSRPVSKIMKEDPGQVLVHAVKYMLPKNKTKTDRLKRLIIV